MRQATIAKAQTRPWSTSVGRILRYCATWVFLILVTVVGMLTPLLANTDSAQAATNETVNFQARILQASGALVPDGNYNVEFKIYDSPSSGATGQGVCSLNSSTDDCWWVETRTGANVVRVVNGYVSVNLGSVSPFGASIPWDQELYITMRVGGIGGPVWDTEMVNLTTGRMKLNAAPYAKIAGGLRTTNGVNSTNVTFAAPTGTNTITFGDGSGLVCLNNGNCNGTSGGYLLFGSSTIQNGTSSNELIRANQQGSGGLVDLQSGGTTRFSIGNDGLTTIASGVRIGTTTSAVAGTIRWTGTDYEGYDGAQWRSLTAGAAVTPFAAKTKTINEVQNNVVNPTATLQPDDQLFFAVGANETWNYRFVVQITGNATPDIKFSITAPVGATCVNSISEAENALSVAGLGCGVSSGAVPMTTSTDMYEVAGTVVNGATAGNVTLNWAQNTANAANVTVLAGSFLEAQRSLGGDSADVAYIQGGNSFGATAVLGTNDANALSIVTNGTEKIRVDASGNVGIGDGTPAALLTVGTSDAFQVNASGNILTSGTLSVTGTTTLTGNLLANGSATGVTGTTSGTGTNTTTLTLAADAFAVNDVVLIDNAGQDYYTRVTVDGGTGTYTVSPAVTFENARTVTKYNIQNIGASATDYISQANRFFQGYFLGGITVGTGSTTLADGVLSRTTGNIEITPGSGGIVSVNGTINATAITGDGSAITNIDGSSVSGATITGIDASNISTGTLADTRLSSNVTLLGNTFNGLNQLVQLDGTGALPALNASGLTTLNASNISSGTLADGRLSSNVALLSGTQSFSGLKTFSAGATITGGQTFTIGGKGFTDIQGTGLALSSGVLEVAYGSVAGTAVEGSTQITCPSGSGNLTGGGGAITLGAGGSCGSITTNNAVTFTTSVTSPLFTSSGALELRSGGANTVTIDTGASAGITIAGTNASSLALGRSGIDVTINGNTLVLGTSTIRRTASGTTNVELNDAADTTLNIVNTNGGATASVTIEGDISATNVSGAGAGLTALNATNVASGTLGDARLSANVTRLDTSQTFSAGQTFSSGLTISAGQAVSINGESFSDLTGTGLVLSGSSLAIDTTYFNSNYIQLGSASLQTDASNNATIGINKTSATGNLITLQRSGVAAFTVANTGALQIRATSTTGLDIQTGGGVSTFSVDTSGNIVRVGQSTADGTGVLFVLDTKNTSADPTGENGAQYFNSARGTFRCYENGRGWTDCLGVAKPNTRRSTQFLASGTGATMTSDGGDIATVTGTGSAAAATTTTPAAVNYATANGGNSDTGIVGNTNYNTSFNPSMQTNVRLLSTVSTRNWIGFTNQTLATMNGGANPAGIYAAFRYDTSAGDTTWQCVTKNGGAQSFGNSGIAPSTNEVEMEIIIVGTTRVEFKIDGVQVCSLATNVPAANTMMRYNISRRNLVAGIQNIQVAWLYIDSDQ